MFPIRAQVANKHYHEYVVFIRQGALYGELMCSKTWRFHRLKHALQLLLRFRGSLEGQGVFKQYKQCLNFQSINMCIH